MKHEIRKSLALAILSMALPTTTQLHAATVISGSLTASFDQATFGYLGLTNLNFFDQADNNLTAAQLLTESGAAGWSGLEFGINGSIVNSPSGRTLQPTSFTYAPGNLTGTASGQIGLGGVTRWDVDPMAGGGEFLLGDYSLQYDAARAGGVYSGWYLINHLSYSAIAFDFANTTSPVVSANGFSFSGDLYVRADSGLSLFGFPSDVSYGTFSLNASTVPEPGTAGLLLLAAGAGVYLAGLRRAKA
ncbi:MAG TPA: PEP-CTERM sorting domain-containing protein [Terrimicrobiaceae bacterium]|nr:PEP-CTERM sorting domain-containing protein [Terrimicrobiaceae bacterium]